MHELWRIISKTTLCLIAVGFVAMLMCVVYLEAKLPSCATLKDIKLQIPLRVYSFDNKLIAEYGEKRRVPIPYANIPQDLINAVLATEDRRFFQHPGVDIRGIARAAVNLVSTGMKEQGGSTITMQVARNFFLTRHKTYLRKLNEILLAFKIETKLSKEEILGLYLNKIYLGKQAYGVGAAAKVYYGKEIHELNLPEIAMIAGLPKAPSTINPINSPKSAKNRRKHVLDRMLRYGFIDETRYRAALETPETAKYHRRKVELKAPYIAEMVRKELYKQYGNEIYSSGYEVYTTVDSKLQKHANRALLRALLEYDRRHGYKGPYKHFELDDSLSLDDEINTWLAYLKTLPEFGRYLFPVVVTNVSTDENTAYALDKQKKVIPLGVQGARWAFKVKKKAELKDKQIATVLKPGDVIYVQKYGKRYRLSQLPEVEGAIVSMAPKSGAIVSLVGGLNYQKSNFNRVTQASRQPGSAFKPFIYSAAINYGLTPATIVNDAPIVQIGNATKENWRPHNDSKKFYGPTRLREALIKSRNLVSIRLLQDTGLDKTIEFLTGLGFAPENLPHGLSLALGSGLINPLDLTTAYCIFPSGGYRVEPFFIDRIIDARNETIFRANNPIVTEYTSTAMDSSPYSYKPSALNNKAATRVMQPQIAYTVTSLLKDTIQRGTSRRVKKLGRDDLAGKTGTTNDNKDNWYAGFNGQIVTTAWVGYDDPSSLKEYARTTALPMWMYFMEAALKDIPSSKLAEPPGMVTVRIDPATGLLARQGQSDSMYEIFLKDRVPTKFAPAKKLQPTVKGINESREPQSKFEELF